MEVIDASGDAEGSSKLELYHQQFNADFKVTSEQRDKSNEELRFAMIAGGQWEGFLKDSFANRARIELDQTSDYLYRTYAQWTNNRIGVAFAADDEHSTEDDADLLGGLYRRDLRRRAGQAGVDQSVFEAMACGYGAFELTTEYEDEEDPDNKDQCVCFSELANAFASVVWDSGARRRDKKDARHCTVLIPHSPEGFKEKYPEAPIDGRLIPQDRRWFNWVTPKLVYEAKRYEVRVEEEMAYTYGHPETQDIVRLSEVEQKTEESELTAAGYEKLSEKKIKKRNVYLVKFCGTVILEAERRIAGKFIPVVPVYGYAAHIDGVDYWHGVIRKRIDGQRLLNMSASLMAEAAASATEDKPIFTPAQVQNVKSLWAADRHQHPYLLADVIRHPDTGQLEHVGPVGMMPGASQSAAAQTLLQTVRELIMQGTGGAPQDTLDPDASGKAINAVMKRVDMNTQPIFDNIATALQHCGEVYRWIAAEVYAERTRNVSVVTPEGAMQRKTLLQVGTKGGQITYHNDVSRGRFEVVAETGPSYQTQREETLAALKDIVTAIPPGDPLGQIVLGRIIELLPSQGMNDVKAYIRKQLLLQGVTQPETPEDMKILQSAAQSQQQQPPSAEDQAALAFAQDKRMAAAERVAKIKKLTADTQASMANAALLAAKARATVMGAHGDLLQRAAGLRMGMAAGATNTNQRLRPPLRLVSSQ